MHKIRLWLSRVMNPRDGALPAIAEDFRKVGVTAIGVGLVGLFIPQVNASVGSSVLLLVFGLIIWLMGIITHRHVQTGRKE